MRGILPASHAPVLDRAELCHVERASNSLSVTPTTDTCVLWYRTPVIDSIRDAGIRGCLQAGQSWPCRLLRQAILGVSFAGHVLLRGFATVNHVPSCVAVMSCINGTSPEACTQVPLAEASTCVEFRR